METLTRLNAMLRLMASNFQILHWNASGEDFDDTHKSITTDYYELCDKYIDSTAEMVARLDGFVYDLKQVVKVADELRWICVDSETLYDRSTTIAICQEILSSIYDQIVECLCDAQLLEPCNAGIQSELENMLEEFDVQFRFINKRRMLNK